MIVFERYGFHFTPTALTKDWDDLFLVVKMKDRSKIDSPRYSVWEYSEEEYVSFIQETLNYLKHFKTSANPSFSTLSCPQ